MDYTDLGKRIRKQRVLLGLTQEKLAAKVGVSTSFIGLVERGKRKASLETLVSLANVMDVSTDYLLSGSLSAETLGPNPHSLNPNQRMVMQEILTALQDHLSDWDSGAGTLTQE